MNPRFSRYYTYIKPILRNTTVKTYSPIVFSIVTMFIFGLFAVKPTISTIISLQKSIQEQKQVLEKLTTKAENLSLGKSNYQNIDPATKIALNNLLPDKTDLPTLIDDLASLSNGLEASVSGLQFQPVNLVGQPVKLKKDAKLQRVDFTYNLQGTYPQFNEFLNRLANSKRLISVQSVTITRSGETGLLMSLNANAYFLN